MGLLLLRLRRAIEMPKAIPITIGLLVSMLTQLKFMVIVAFTRVGLFKPPEDAAYSGEHSHNNDNHVLMWGGSASPSLVPVPVPIPIITASIKKTLPILQYSKFLEEEEEEEEEAWACAVCLDCIDRSHYIRELSNCCHVFHVECLDRWVDEGRVTCPLCRSMLLPPNTNPWMLLRNAHLSPQDHQIQITPTT